MNSPFANLFLALQEQVHTHVSEIAYIDQDLGQLNSKTRPPVSWPCVLIDFEGFSFDDLSENVQTAKGTVVLRLGFAPYSNSSVATPPDYKTLALNYYDLEWKLHLAIQGWSPAGDACGHLIRSSATTCPRTDNYRVRELRYKIAFDDYSTKLQKLTTPATLIINDEIAL